MNTAANTSLVASLRVKEGNIGGTGTADVAATDGDYYWWRF